MFSLDVRKRLAAVERRLDLIEGIAPPARAPSSTNQVSDDDIRAAYRIFLNREPDDSGFEHYRRKARSGAFSFDDLINGMTDCEEYRQKNAREIATVDVGGVRVAIDPDEPEFGRAIARDGTWEPHIVQTIRQNLKAGDTFVDVGANVGIMSFHAAAVVGPAGRVIAFEPNQDNVQRFLQGVLLNKLENVTIYPFAASDAASIFSIQGHSNTYLVQASTGGRLTQAMRADDLLQTVDRVDFIKIDIEGHEPHAIAGLSETLSRQSPLVLCEFNPRCLSSNIGRDPDEFAREIFKLTEAVEIVEHDASLTKCTSAGHLMQTWRERNRQNAETGALPDGMLHFDLLFRCA
jgi:FkbM family methyltransferase